MSSCKGRYIRNTSYILQIWRYICNSTYITPEWEDIRIAYMYKLCERQCKIYIIIGEKHEKKNWCRGFTWSYCWYN